MLVVSLAVSGQPSLVPGLSLTQCADTLLALCLLLACLYCALSVSLCLCCVYVYIYVCHQLCALCVSLSVLCVYIHMCVRVSVSVCATSIQTSYCGWEFSKTLDEGDKKSAICESTHSYTTRAHTPR